MKNFLLAFGLLLATAASSAATWIPMGPPPQTPGANPPYLEGIAVSPDYIFAAADEGVYRSPDRGITWELTGPGSDQSRGMLSLAVDPRNPATVYAGAYAGLYKSTDAGATWTLVFSQQVAYTVVVDPVSPNVVYVGGGPFQLDLARLYRSRDGGATWEVLLTAADYYQFTAIAVSPLDPDTIYAGTHLGTLYESTDGGASWSASSGSFPGQITSIVLDPAGPETVYVSSTATIVPMGPPLGSILRSRDGGTNWTLLEGVPRQWVGALAMDPQSSTHLVTSAYGVVYETKDGGDDWKPVSDAAVPLYAKAIVFDPQRPETVYLASGSVYTGDLSAPECDPTMLCAQGGRFQVTVDWQGTPLGPSLRAHAVPVTDDSGYFWFFTPDNIEIMVKVLDGRPVNGAYWVFFGALSNVAYRVTVRDTVTSAVWTHDNRWGEMASVADTNAFPSAGDSQHRRSRARSSGSAAPVAPGSWIPLGPRGGANPAQVFSVAVDPRSPLIVYAAYEDYYAGLGGVARSTDGGAHWVLTELAQHIGSVLVDPSSPDHVYAAGDGGVFRSWDSGLTWTPASTPDSYVLGAGGGDVYAGIVGGILESSDSGVSWTALRVPIGADDDLTAITVDSADPGRIYAGTASGKILTSADFGQTWTLLRSTVDQVVGAIAVDPSQPGLLHAGTLHGGPAPAGPPLQSPYLRSVDGGITWEETLIPAPYGTDVRALAVDPSRPGLLYAGGSGGAFQSTDAGRSWTAIDFSPPAEATSLALGGSTLYAGTYDGAFRLDLDTSSCVPDGVTLCLNDSRFQVRASFQVSPDGPAVEARPIALTHDTGSFWFFEPANVELVVKVLDGRPVNGKFWVFVGGLSSVQYTIEVTDTESGAVWTHDHAPGDLESFADTAAF
jgi:photosystem II stability/assembly factor-like uncharacterized protein